MQVWIDGDACPKVIKDILFRMSIRTETHLMIVSNHPLSIPLSPFIKKILVGSGFDKVDHYIVEHLQAGDLVVTADIPFADAVITQGGFALNPRGELYSASNIKQHLGRRNLNEAIRGSGLMISGPDKLNPREVQRFANNLDKWITQHT